jgi:hypothetical protein
LKWRYDKNKGEIEEITKKFNLKIMNCQVEILYKQNRKEQNKEKEFIKEFSGKFKELNNKIEKEFQGYGVSLNLSIHCRRAKAREKHKIPLTIEYDIFPSITQNKEETNYINNCKKKQVRLIKPTKVKTMEETLNSFKRQITKWKSDLSNSRDSTINYLEYLNINQPIIPAKKFAKYRGRAKFMIEELNKQIRKVITHEELIKEFESIYFTEEEEEPNESISSKDKLCKYEILDNWTSKWLKLMMPLQQANQNNPLKPKKKSYKRSNSKIHPRTFQLWLHRTKSLAVKKEKLASKQSNEKNCSSKKESKN